MGAAGMSAGADRPARPSPFYPYPTPRPLAPSIADMSAGADMSATPRWFTGGKAMPKQKNRAPQDDLSGSPTVFQKTKSLRIDYRLPDCNERGNV
jgi:hypothetical protein